MIRPLRRSDKKSWTEVQQRNRDWLSPWDASSPGAAVQLPNFGQMIRILQQRARAGAAMPFAIMHQGAPGSWSLAGQLTVDSIIWGSARTATAGYWVDQDLAGRNIVPTALALATDHCLTGMGLHRMEVNIRPENAPSLRVAAKLGFRYEGLRERYLHINGAWADHCSFALTSDELPPGGLIGRLREQGMLAS